MPHVDQKNSKGEKLPSVTQVTGIYDKNLDGWRKWMCGEMTKKDFRHKEQCCLQACEAVKDEAVETGEKIHEARALWLQGKDTDALCLDEREQRLFDVLRSFYTDNGYKPVAVEPEWKTESLSGSPDGIGTFQQPFWGTEKKFWAIEPPRLPKPGELWIDDLKVKNSIDWAHPLQGFGYRVLAQEILGKTIDWFLILRLNKKDEGPPYEVKGYYLPYYEQHWRATELMYVLKKTNGKRIQV